MRSALVQVRDTVGLAEALRRSGLTQVDLANKAGCTKQFISKLARGKSGVCSVEIAHAIEEALQVVAGSIFVPRDLPARKVRRTRQESDAA